jgi:hypothetical protein
MQLHTRPWCSNNNGNAHVERRIEVKVERKHDDDDNDDTPQQPNASPSLEQRHATVSRAEGFLKRIRRLAEG